MYGCIYIYVYMYICICVHTYIVYMYICVYIYIYMWVDLADASGRLEAVLVAELFPFTLAPPSGDACLAERARWDSGTLTPG